MLGIQRRHVVSNTKLRILKKIFTLEIWKLSDNANKSLINGYFMFITNNNVSHHSKR